MTTRRWLALLLSVLLAIGLPVAGEAAQGDLDPSFGGTGTVTTPVGWMAGAWAVAVQADGKIVAAGFGDNASFDDFQQRLALVRYLTDGTVDAAFGTNGRVLVDVPDVNLERAALVIQGDGKILVVSGALGANGNSDFLIARYDASGAPDPGFGVNGIVLTDFGDYEEATGVALQSDGKIVVAGVRGAPLTATTDFALARYDGATGALDGTFGSGGKVVTDVGGADRANGVAIQADGKIVAAGTMHVVPNRFFAVVRYDVNGGVDLTFGGGTGQVTTPFFQDTEGTAVAIQADQKIVVVGTTDVLNVPGLPNTRLDFALARYNPDGSLDGTFGTGGLVTTDFAFGYERAYAVAIQKDGRILVAGSRADASDIELHVDFALARYETNGTLDGSFGTGGQVVVDFGAVDAAGGVALQADCKIVMAGYSWDFAGSTGEFVFALSRHDGPACAVEPPVASACPRSHGHWKTDPIWPVTSLTLGAQTYTKAQLLTLLNMSGSTDASITLSRQLIAAKLNIANGSDPSPVSSTVVHADTLLAGFGGLLPYKVKTSSPTGKSMVEDARMLDDYNNGVLTPSCTP